MNKIKLSILIPYKKRLENLEVIFEGLVNQTMNSSEFEVIIGAMEYCEKFISVCKKFNNYINIISVLSDKDFSIPCARNLAMKQASGKVLVHIDADTLLPKNMLQKLYDRYFSFDQQVCVVGQVIGYENNNDGDIKSVGFKPYIKYRDELLKLEKPRMIINDPRFQVTHNIPWAFGWTGLIALPLATIKKNNLYFDEGFKGWGVDDLEWSFRICDSKVPIVLCEDIRAIHLPHIKKQSDNEKSEKENYKYFLKKWPRVDVELAYTFGDFQANNLFPKYTQEQKNIIKGTEHKFSVVRGKVEGKDTLLIGVIIDEKENIINSKIVKFFDNNSKKEILPLLGMALPYLEDEIYKCYILPIILEFSKIYKEKIIKEVNRVSKKVSYFTSNS